MASGNASNEGKGLLPPHVVPMKGNNDFFLREEPKRRRVQMERPRLAEKGQSIALLTNHFKVSVKNMDGHFFHYSVNLKDQNNQPIWGKGIGRKAIDTAQQTHDTELGNKWLAYDGEKSLFTMSRLPHKNNEYPITLDNIPSNKSGCQVKLQLSLVAEIPMQSVDNAQEALRVLVITIRQLAVNKGFHLIGRSYFHDNPSNCTDLGGGVYGYRGFHSSLRPVQGGLSLNINNVATISVRPGPVIDFLTANQNLRDPCQLDWEKAKRMLKNLRVKIRNMEFKITGLTELPCNQQTFTLRPRGDCRENSREITVCDYYEKHRGIPLSYSANLPCIKVGKPKNPAYFPIEVCNLVSLQRYTKELTVQQRASFVEKSRQKPQETIFSVTNALKYMKYDSEPMLQECGVSISTHCTQLEGRVLQPPKLIFGNGEQSLPRNGRWNLNNKKLITPVEVERWAFVNFSDRSNTNSLIHDLITCGSMKGITVKQPLFVFEEDIYMRRAAPAERVEVMFDQIMTKLNEPPKFILCHLSSERTKSLIYGPWKRKCLVEFGIATQCMARTRVNYQYLTNLLLKINAKLGGINSLLQLENTTAFPIVSKAATIILGIDVSHGSPGRSDVPSIAAVVSSRQWPLFSKYRASVRTQSPKDEMIDSMFKLVSHADGSGTYDAGIIGEAFVDFYATSGKRKPEQIIIFRDGVGENQFRQVLNVELNQIKEACKFLDGQWFPKITLIIAQKKQHTKFFLASGSPDNVPPGTVVDKQVCHPGNYNFYMCSQAGIIGTSRPTHYHVLHDENELNPDDLQELVHSLSYVYQRSTTAISVVAPIYYAHLAAAQAANFIKFEDYETSSSQQEITTPGAVPVPELPILHMNVKNSMFFC